MSLKKKWERPQLVALRRQSVPEAVLFICKCDIAETGPGGTDNSCNGQACNSCDTCIDT